VKRVWFTGTREGMTLRQMDTLQDLLARLRATHDVFHHGDCIGADAQAHEIAKALGYRTEAHPSNIPGMRAFCNADVVHPEKAPLDRNRDMVDIGDTGVGAPHGPEEQRSGTWSTVRYARKVGRPVVIVWPDGRETNG
jgi:hypothetical protein